MSYPHYFPSSPGSSHVKAARLALLSMDGSGLPSHYKLEVSPGGSKASIMQAEEKDTVATVQVMPNGTMRFSARADCFELLPQQEILHDWTVTNDGMSCTLLSSRTGKAITVNPADEVAFTTGVVNLNPVNAKTGKAWPLNAKGDNTEPPPQESKGKKGGEAAAKEGDGAKEADAMDAKADKDKAKQSAPTEGDLQAEAQAGDGGEDGDGDSNKDSDPPPVEDDKLPDEQKQDNKGSGGKPPPPIPPFSVGQAVLIATKGIIDNKTGKAVTATAVGQVVATVLALQPGQMLVQRWDNGRYVTGSPEKLGNPLPWGECPYVPQPNSSDAREINIKHCPKGMRFVAVGEVLTGDCFVSAPLGGDADQLNTPARPWHLVEDELEVWKEKVVKTGNQHHLPFSYYIRPLSEVQLHKGKEGFEINGWKFEVIAWNPAVTTR